MSYFAERTLDDTTLSSKGQVIIPKPVRDAMGWPPGTVFRVEAREGGVLLKPWPIFEPTQAGQVAGCLKAAGTGPAKSGPRAIADEERSLRRRALAEDRATRA